MATSRSPRLGYGAMRITGKGIWAIRRTVRRPGGAAAHRGARDRPDRHGGQLRTAVSEDLIREALHTGDTSDPYGGVTIATKGGRVRTGPERWVPVGRPDTLAAARELVPIASVQNRYNLLDRGSRDVLEVCERDGLGFIPWFPVATGRLAASGGPLDELAEETGATPAQLALAWLLRTSPVMLPIPGTSSLEHLEENVAAAAVDLTDEQVAQLDAIAA